jgi:hypothetical protein
VMMAVVLEYFHEVFWKIGSQPDGVSPRFHDFLVSAIPDFF